MTIKGRKNMGKTRMSDMTVTELREIMKKKNITKTTLASEIGICENTIYRWLKTGRIPESMAQLIRLKIV